MRRSRPLSSTVSADDDERRRRERGVRVAAACTVATSRGSQTVCAARPSTTMSSGKRAASVATRRRLWAGWSPRTSGGRRRRRTLPVASSQRSLFGGANANVNATGGFPCGALRVSSGASVVARCGGPPSGAQQDGPDGTAALCAVGIPVVFTKGSHLNVTSLGYEQGGALGGVAFTGGGIVSDDSVISVGSDAQGLGSTGTALLGRGRRGFTFGEESRIYGAGRLDLGSGGVGQFHELPSLLSLPLLDVSVGTGANVRSRFDSGRLWRHSRSLGCWTAGLPSRWTSRASPEL